MLFRSLTAASARLKGHTLITDSKKGPKLCIKVKNRRRPITIREVFADEGIPTTLVLCKTLSEWLEKVKKPKSTNMEY